MLENQCFPRYHQFTVPTIALLFVLLLLVWFKLDIQVACDVLNGKLVQGFNGYNLMRLSQRGGATVLPDHIGLELKSSSKFSNKPQ